MGQGFVKSRAAPRAVPFIDDQNISDKYNSDFSDNNS